MIDHDSCLFNHTTPQRSATSNACIKESAIEHSDLLKRRASSQPLHIYSNPLFSRHSRSLMPHDCAAVGDTTAQFSATTAHDVAFVDRPGCHLLATHAEHVVKCDRVSGWALSCLFIYQICMRLSPKAPELYRFSPVSVIRECVCVFQKHN